MNDRQQLREELEDRLTDQALAEALGGKRPPDLSDDILAAASHRRRYWGMRPRVALAASLLMLLGLGAMVYVQYSSYQAPPRMAYVSESRMAYLREHNAEGDVQFYLTDPVDEAEDATSVDLAPLDRTSFSASGNRPHASMSG